MAWWSVPQLEEDISAKNPTNGTRNLASPLAASQLSVVSVDDSLPRGRGFVPYCSHASPNCHRHPRLLPPPSSHLRPLASVLFPVLPVPQPPSFLRWPIVRRRSVTYEKSDLY